MAKLILKAPYYKQGHKTEDGRGRGGYAEYIATRKGVELLRGGMVNYIGQRKGSCGLFSDEGVPVVTAVGGIVGDAVGHGDFFLILIT